MRYKIYITHFIPLSFISKPGLRKLHICVIELNGDLHGLFTRFYEVNDIDEKRKHNLKCRINQKII